MSGDQQQFGGEDMNDFGGGDVDFGLGSDEEFVSAGKCVSYEINFSVIMRL